MRGRAIFALRIGDPVRASALALTLLALHPLCAGAVLPAAEPVGARAPIDGLARQSASPEVRYVAQWVGDSADNAGMPYIIIAKVNARVFVLDAQGHLQGTAPALLGMVAGDGTAAGIGEQKLAAIRPEQRTTPAGRFVAYIGRDLHGKDILWIDYASALALHRVVKGTPAEHRAQRLQSATALDNRISYGCINVPVKFYDTIVAPAFAHTSGVVYILPEKSTARSMFPRSGTTAVARSPATAQP